MKTAEQVWENERNETDEEEKFIVFRTFFDDGSVCDSLRRRYRSKHRC